MVFTSVACGPRASRAVSTRPADWPLWHSVLLITKQRGNLTGDRMRSTLRTRNEACARQQSPTSQLVCCAQQSSAMALAAACRAEPAQPSEILCGGNWFCKREIFISCRWLVGLPLHDLEQRLERSTSRDLLLTCHAGHQKHVSPPGLAADSHEVAQLCRSSGETRLASDSQQR